MHFYETMSNFDEIFRIEWNIFVKILQEFGFGFGLSSTTGCALVSHEVNTVCVNNSAFSKGKQENCCKTCHGLKLWFGSLLFLHTTS